MLLTHHNECHSIKDGTNVRHNPQQQNALGQTHTHTNIRQ